MAVISAVRWPLPGKEGRKKLAMVLSKYPLQTVARCPLRMAALMLGVGRPWAPSSVCACVRLAYTWVLVWERMLVLALGV